jgi:hypothetical protein
VSRRRLQRLGRDGTVAGQTVRCVYCLRSVEEATEDHVIAQSWYPESTPENVEKWKVPSCRPCNTRYSKLEDDFKIRLAFCVDPANPAAQGVYERARRALDPHMGKNPTDRRLRRERKKKIYKDLLDFDTQPQGVLPFSAKNFDRGSRLGILISKDLDKLIEKWVKGLHFLLFSRYITDKDTIEIMHADDELFIRTVGPFSQHATAVRKGPGVEVTYLSAEEGQERHTLYRFNIWAQFQTYAYVVDQTGDDSPELG